jgi:hypothetical protein
MKITFNPEPPKGTPREVLGPQSKNCCILSRDWRETAIFDLAI